MILSFIIRASRRVGRAGASGRLPAPSGAVRGVGGAAGAIGIGRKGGRVLAGGRFVSARQQPCRLRLEGRRFAGQAGE